MKPKVGDLEPGGFRRPAALSVDRRRRLYNFLVTLCNILLEPLLKILVYLANKYDFGRQLARDKGRVKAKDLITGRFLGQGCSGIFYETTWSGSPESMARLARKDFPGVKGDVFESEVVPLFELKNHLNVVKTMCWTVDNRSCSLVMEYVSDDLSSVIRRKKEALRKMVPNQQVVGTSPSPFELLEAMKIALQIATGMEFLHDSGITHGDLKPNNVFIDWKEGQMLVKLADFGLMETKKRTTLISQHDLCLRMIEWSAPELFERYFVSMGEEFDYMRTTLSTGDSDLSTSSASDFDEKTKMELADSYSFALTCAYILGGQTWNPKLSPNQLREKILSSGSRPVLPSECPQKLASLIRKCWDANPKRRPTFSIIRNELQEIVTDQQKQEEQRNMRNLVQVFVREQLEQEVQQEKETLGNVRNTLQEFVKEKKLQEVLWDIRNTMQDSKNDIKGQLQRLQDICNKLQEIVKEMQAAFRVVTECVQTIITNLIVRWEEFNADSSSFKAMEWVRLNPPIPEAFDAGSSKIISLHSDPDMLLRKGKALVSDYIETKETIPSVLNCTEERETFKDVHDQIQTNSRPDGAGPSDQFRDEGEQKHEAMDILRLPPIETSQVQRHLMGMEEHLNTCINKLEKMEKMSGATRVLCIVGMGGIGKTFLAKEIYNYLVGQKKFQAMSFVEIDPNLPSSMEVKLSLLSRLQKHLLRDLLHVPENTQISYKNWFHKLSSQGPVLVVLDGIYDKNQFDELILNTNLFAPGSLIIVTSRDQHLLRVVAKELNFYLHEVTPMVYGDSQKLLNLQAFHNEEATENFKALADGVSIAGNGLLLALKVIRSSLFDGTTIEDQECIWPKVIDALKKAPNVASALEWISNQRNSNPEKLIFLGIACIFLGQKKLDALEIRNICRKVRTIMVQTSNEVRAIDLTNNSKLEFEVENLTRMHNLQNIRLPTLKFPRKLKSFGSILWSAHLLPMLNLSNLKSLDFSQSAKLAYIWADSNPALEACPNLLKLDLTLCTSITGLPDSIGSLSRLQLLALDRCANLRKLPNSFAQLSSLVELRLQGCRSLEALPDSITALSRLQKILMYSCESISKLSSTIGLPAGLTDLRVDLAVEGQAVGIGRLNALRKLEARQCTDGAIAQLDRLGALRNLNQLSGLCFSDCPTATKLPETMGLLTNLNHLVLYGCERLQELPSSIGQLKVLTRLYLRKCTSLERLPDSLGALKSLQYLWIVMCTSLTTLPTSIGLLSSLQNLRIESGVDFQSLPHSLSQLNALEQLTILDCGSLEGLGALRALQGLRIWGCTSITKLPGSCLMVSDSNFCDPAWYYDFRIRKRSWVRRHLKEVRVVEANDCGFLRIVQDTRRGRSRLQRVHRWPCRKLTAQNEQFYFLKAMI